MQKLYFFVLLQVITSQSQLMSCAAVGVVFIYSHQRPEYSEICHNINDNISGEIF